MDSILRYFTDFSPEQIRQLEALLPLYREWNEKINVISRKDMDHFYAHHVLHSLAIATQFSFQPGTRIMDLGCGGGFPGVPLAILFPDTQFLLVDSIQKKLKVVSGVAEAAGIRNVQTLHSRAEDIRGQQFDAIVSRAVAPLKDLWRWSRPLLKKGSRPGGLICLKGGDLTQEIHESGCRPRVWEIEKIFPEPYFHEKYLLQVQ